MYTIDELADELNRQEWAVERMLKNRGYLKQNGDPRKSTIDDGYMNKNGLITKSGWEAFIDELGYKDSDDEDEEEELNEENDEEIDDEDDEEEEEDLNEKDDEESEEDDDENPDDEEEEDNFELPKICSEYRGWSICVEKDDEHGYVITATLFNAMEFPIDSIEVNGDEIGDRDPEEFIVDKIDEREEDRQNWHDYDPSPDDPDWSDSWDPD